MRKMASSPPEKKTKRVRGLKERLAAGETILCAEGYLLAFVRAGYVLQGLWVPEFVLDYPDVLRNQHLEFVRAGSDVTEAYQYHTNRLMLERVNIQDRSEEINRVALKIAREVADETGTLCAGGLSSTNLFKKFPLSPEDDPSDTIREILREQVSWSKDEGVDYIIAETMWSFAEAKIAVEVIKSFDLPAVVTMAVRNLKKKDGTFQTQDGMGIPEACRQLAEMGATLVGVNCGQGPGNMIELVRQICKVVPPEKVCALPITYRTTNEEPIWQVLTDKAYPKNNPVYPNGLEPFYVTRMEVAEFTKQCLELGMRYLGLCCGNTGSYTRAMAEVMGKESILSVYHKNAAKAQAVTKEFMEKVNSD